MQAIKTEYKGATNTRGSRIVASCDARHIVVSYDHEFNTFGNHRAGASELLTRMQWSGVYAGGGHKGDYYWVEVPIAGKTWDDTELAKGRIQTIGGTR